MEIVKAKTGFCYGILRAYKQINELVEQEFSVYVGHKCKVEHKNNEWDVFYRIEKRDPVLLANFPNLERVKVVHDFDTLSHGDHLVVGHHGLMAELMTDLIDRGVIIHNFKCPFIKKMDEISETLASEGYNLIAFGKPGNHHCLYSRMAAERVGRVCLISEDAALILKEIGQSDQKWACVGQVTGNVNSWNDFAEQLKVADIDVRIIDTVCADSHARQAEAIAIAKEAEAVIVVDDGGGASTSIFETCAAINSNTYRIGSHATLPEGWDSKITKIGIVGGILVPTWVIDQTAQDLMTQI